MLLYLFTKNRFSLIEIKNMIRLKYNNISYFFTDYCCMHDMGGTERAHTGSSLCTMYCAS